MKLPFQRYTKNKLQQINLFYRFKEGLRARKRLAYLWCSDKADDTWIVKKVPSLTYLSFVLPAESVGATYWFHPGSDNTNHPPNSSRFTFPSAAHGKLGVHLHNLVTKKQHGKPHGGRRRTAQALTSTDNAVVFRRHQRALPLCLVVLEFGKVWIVQKEALQRPHELIPMTCGM